MNKFYGEVEGNRGVGSRVGTLESGLRSSAQSNDGSIVVKLHYEGDKLMVEIGTMAWSASNFNYPNWWGTFEEFDTFDHICHRYSKANDFWEEQRELIREIYNDEFGR